MVCPPRNLAFRGSMGRSGAFAEFGQASTPRTPPAFWALVEGYYVRQKASGQLVENAFGDFCGCALIAKKADDAALHIYQTNIQYHTPLPSVLMLRFGVDLRSAVAPINGVRLATSDTNYCAGRYFTPFPFSLQFVCNLDLCLL